jgi:hypothetical protein
LHWKRTKHAPPPAHTEPKPPGRWWPAVRIPTLPPMEQPPMKPDDLAAPVRAIDILRIALDLPTAAERKARIEREISTVKMQAHAFGVTVTFADGRRVLLTETALTGKE